MNFKKEWITDRITEAAIIETDELGKRLCRESLTPTQIRNFFGEVRRIQLNGIKGNETSFLLLKPKLAYAAKRAENDGAKTFKDIMLKAIDSVEIDKPNFEKRFENFTNFLEAIVAFHKSHYTKKD